MKNAKYHLQQLPTGWIGLVAGEKGLRRATLKPTPAEAKRIWAPTPTARPPTRTPSAKRWTA